MKTINFLFLILLSIPTISFASQTHWDYGSGMGSKSHWDYGSGRTFPKSPFLDICIGLIINNRPHPNFCIIYPNLKAMLD